MRIVVAYKWAADPQEASVSADGQVDFSRAKSVVSEYDAVAVEVASRLVAAQGGEVIGLSVGTKDAGAPMATKSALARGLDKAVLVTDESLQGAGTAVTAEVLAAAVTRIGEVDLVLTGDSSIDTGARMVPTVLAGRLGWPVVSDVASVTVVEGTVQVERSVPGGIEVLQITGPAVLSIATDAAVAKVPGMKDVLAAGKKPVEAVALADLDVDLAGLAPEVLAVSKPERQARRQQVIDTSDPAQAAAELVSALRDAGVL